MKNKSVSLYISISVHGIILNLFFVTKINFTSAQLKVKSNDLFIQLNKTEI